MPFQLITPRHQEMIQGLVDRIPDSTLSVIAETLAVLIDQIKNDIPQKRRASIGRYSIVKALGAEIYPLLEEAGIRVLKFAEEIFLNPEHDPFVRSIAIQIFSLYSIKTGDLGSVLPYFEKAAADQDWIARECASGLVRKLTRAFPGQIRSWYLELVKSDDPNQRRFVSESLRPVVENRWFHKDPEYALGIISHLFKEAEPYPRTSVGNNLSDWMRVNEGLAWPIVQELAQNGDQNSYWIATRACRNIVKKEPVKVMRLLDIEEYKYKNRRYKLTDYQ